jgi:DNA-binding Lrp family transcriptional regulator
MDFESKIRKLYIDHQLPLRSVAKRLNIPTPTLRRRMKILIFSLEIRNQHFPSKVSKFEVNYYVFY